MSSWWVLFLLLALAIPPTSPLLTHHMNAQVAHGLILRCFVKRWLGFSLDFPLQMMLAPGAIAVLRYVKHGQRQPPFGFMLKQSLLVATRTTISRSLPSPSA